MPKPTQTQKSAFKRLQKIDSKAEIRWDKKTGAPTRVRGALSGPQTGAPETIARQFLAATKGMYAMKAPEKELQLKGIGTDRRGNRHVRFQQLYKGLPVFGGELIVHMDNGNAIRGVNSKFAPKINLPSEPTVSSDDAKQKVLKHAPDNKEVTGLEPTLLVLVHEDKPYLAWHITVAGTCKTLKGSKMGAKWEYFVDALTGDVIWRYNNLQTHTRTTGTGTGKYSGTNVLNTVHNHTTDNYELEDQWLPTTARIFTHHADGYLDEVFWWICPPKPVSEDDNNNWSAASQGIEVDCHVHTRAVYDYFLLMHGRDSYDDAGSDMHIYAHVGTDYDNAFWNGTCVQIGDGDGVESDTFCTLDIVAHEWTHAVTEYTANLIYSNESGALNESMSDVFAALIDGDWLQGEDNWLLTSAPAGRNLADPSNGGQYDGSSRDTAVASVLAGHQPDHMDDKWTWLGAENDNGGVHVNSGIMNKVAHLIATGGRHYDVTVCEGLGREVMGRLYYQALSSILTPSSDFEDMRDAVLDALHDLYEGDPRYDRWRVSINNAFASVGIGTEETCPAVCWIAPIPVCPVSPTVVTCPPQPTISCPPQPMEACPPSPVVICPPSPTSICPSAPGGGCLPGPDPTPFQPKMESRKSKKKSK